MEREDDLSIEQHDNDYVVGGTKGSVDESDEESDSESSSSSSSSSSSYDSRSRSQSLSVSESYSSASSSSSTSSSEVEQDDDDDDSVSVASSYTSGSVSYDTGEDSSTYYSSSRPSHDETTTTGTPSIASRMQQQQQQGDTSTQQQESSRLSPTREEEGRESSSSSSYSQSQSTATSDHKDFYGESGDSSAGPSFAHDSGAEEGNTTKQQQQQESLLPPKENLVQKEEEERRETEYAPPRRAVPPMHQQQSPSRNRSSSLERTLTAGLVPLTLRSPTSATMSSLSVSQLGSSPPPVSFQQQQQQMSQPPPPQQPQQQSPPQPPRLSSTREKMAMQQEQEGKDPNNNDEAGHPEEEEERRLQRRRSVKQQQRKKKRGMRNAALEALEANVTEVGLSYQEKNRKGVRELVAMHEEEEEDVVSRSRQTTTSSRTATTTTPSEPHTAHHLLMGFEALLGALLQLSDELELISTFRQTRETHSVDGTSSVVTSIEALHAVFGYAPTLDRIFSNLKPILQHYLEDTPKEEMSNLLNRARMLVRMLCDLTYRVCDKQEWNRRSETAFVTLLELLDRTTVEISCVHDDVSLPEYQITNPVRKAWSNTGHYAEIKTLYVTNDSWLFRQVCYEVLVSTDQWCPDIRALGRVCDVAVSTSEDSAGQQANLEIRLAPIPPAALLVLDKIHGDPLSRRATMASVLRRLLPQNAVTDTAMLDSFSTIRSTIRNPLGATGRVNMVSISSVPEVPNDPQALGVGGVGKTTLAAMVASHTDVRRHFKDGIAWIYVGPEELTYARYTECLRELVSQLVFYDGDPLFAELLHTPGEPLSKRRRREEGFMIYAHDTVAELLQNRNVLIILDNVLFESDLEWFQFQPSTYPVNRSNRSFFSRQDSERDATTSPNILITSRSRGLLPAADTVEIDLLDEPDAIRLLVTESGQPPDHVMARSKEARSVVRECANHPLAVKTVGRWLNLKHATAGVINSVEEIHEDIAKSIDKILQGGEYQDADMLYEIMSMSFSPAVNGEPTNVIKLCFAAFVTVFCHEQYHSKFIASITPPMIPFATAELLFETLLDLEEDKLFHEGSLFYTQRRDATILIPEALAALGVLKVITPTSGDDPESSENSFDSSRGSIGERRYLQIMHYIQAEYGEYLSREEKGMRVLTEDAERRWNRAFVKAYLSQPSDWDSELPDISRNYAVEMLVSHMLRAEMYEEAADLLSDETFVRGRILALGLQTAVTRQIDDTEILFAKLTERNQKSRGRLDPRKAMKRSYLAIGGQISGQGSGEDAEQKRILAIEAGRAHYNIGFSLAERRCWQAAIAPWETSQELLLSSLGVVEFVAAILFNVGVVYSQMNEYEQALTSLKQCLKIRGRIHGEEHILYAQTIQKIGDVFLGMSDYSEAMESYNWALDVMHFEPSHHRVDIGDILDNMGNIHYSKGEVPQALRSYQDALRSKKVELGDDHPELSVTYQHIGNCLSDQGETEQAIAHFEEAIRLRELDDENEHEKRADILSIEGVLNNLTGRQDEGLRCYEKALEVLVTKAPHKKEKIASLLHLIGCVYLMNGEHKKAMKLFEESLQARRKVLGFVHLDVASTLFNMAFLHQSRGRLDKALKCLEECLKIRQLRLQDSDKVALTHEKVGTLAKAIGKSKKAEIAFEEALRIRKAVHGESHEAVAAVLHELGDLMDEMGEYEEAYRNYVEALEIRRSRLGSDHEDVAATLYSMGFTLHHQGQAKRAIQCFEEALEIRKARQGENSKEVGDILNTMGFLEARRGNLDEALSLLWDALRIRKAQNDDVKVSETLKNIGNVHREKQEYGLALECYEECLRIRRTELGDDHPKVADALIAIGNVNSDMDNINEAMRAYQEAQKIRIMLYGENDESVAAVSQYMGTMEFRSGDLDRARGFLEDFIHIRRENGAENDGDYVNVLFMIGNIHKIQGDDVEAKRCWSEAYRVFQALGLADENPQIAKVMNSLLTTSPSPPKTKIMSNSPKARTPKSSEKRSGMKKRMSSGLIGRLKDTLRDEKMSKYGQRKGRNK